MPRRPSYLANSISAALQTLAGGFAQKITKDKEQEDLANLLNQNQLNSNQFDTSSVQPTEFGNPSTYLDAKGGTQTMAGLPTQFSQPQKAGMFGDQNTGVLAQLAGRHPDALNALVQQQKFRQQQEELNRPKFQTISGNSVAGTVDRQGNFTKQIDNTQPKSTFLRTETVNDRGVTKHIDLYGYPQNGKEVITDRKYQDFTPNASQQSTGGELTSREEKVRDAILRFDYPLPTGGFALRSPYWQKMIGAVMELDPTFDATQYNNKAALRKSFAGGGKESQNIKSLNTVAQHLDKLEELSGALENGNVQIANTVKNFFRKNLGNPSVTNFDATANAVANEAVTVFKNTGATDQEIEHIRNIVGSSSSPTQIAGYIKTIMELVNGRIAALKSTYEQGMKRPLDFQMLDPKTVEIFQRRGINPADISGQNSLKEKYGLE